MKKTNIEQRDQIISLYLSGKTPSEIGTMFNKHPNSISRILKKNNIEKNQNVTTKDSDIKNIISNYISGESIKNLSDKFGISQATVYRILKKQNIKKNNLEKPIKYGTTYIPFWNGIELNSLNLSKLTNEQKNEIVEYLFNFYRKNGFPYTELSNDELIENFNLLQSIDINSILKENNIITTFNQSGVNVFKHFAPHFFEVESGIKDKPSMLSTFLNDKLLKDVIFNRLENNFNMTGQMLRQGLANSKNAYKASTFPPSVAKFLYMKYCKENDLIFDYSSGFGQRLLAALSLPYKTTYIGIDPYKKSLQSNKNIYNFYKNHVPGIKTEIDLYEIGSENFCEEKYINKVNFAFSSPCYFNIEKYSDDKNQSYFGKSYDDFINKWWRKTVCNINKLICSNGLFALNIADKVYNFDIADHMKFIIEENGFELIEKYKMQLTRNTVFNNKKGEHKYEPIFIFRKK